MAMTWLTRFVEAVIGPPWLPLGGLHERVLTAVTPALPEPERARYAAQLGAVTRVMFETADNYANLWFEEPNAPALETRAHVLLLARVAFKLGAEKAKADVSLLNGKLRVVEYSRNVGRLRDVPPSDFQVKILYREIDQQADTQDAPALSPSLVPPWLAEILTAFPAAVVYAPVTHTTSITPFQESDLPDDLLDFWRSTGGLSLGPATIFGAAQRYVQAFGTEDHLIIGRLDFELVGMTRPAPRAVSLFWHDGKPELLGHSLREALPRLLAHAAA